MARSFFTSLVSVFVSISLVFGFASNAGEKKYVKEYEKEPINSPELENFEEGVWTVLEGPTRRRGGQTYVYSFDSARVREIKLAALMGRVFIHEMFFVLQDGRQVELEEMVGEFVIVDEPVSFPLEFSNLSELHIRAEGYDHNDVSLELFMYQRQDEPMIPGDEEVQAIFDSQCVFCHDELTSPENIPSDWLVVDEENGRSRLVESLTEQAIMRMPLGGEPLSEAQVDLIERWSSNLD